MRVKMSKPPPPHLLQAQAGPCPTIIQFVGRPGTGSLPRAIAPPNHPLILVNHSTRVTIIFVCFRRNM